jgi:hypothetical protein
MRQLQFFTTKELAVMRDRTAARNYSPAGEEFRREHQRHRAWGLTQRHAERLRRADRDRRTPSADGNSPEPVSPTSTPSHHTVRPTASPDVAARHYQPGGAQNTTDKPGPPAKGSARPAVMASAGPSGDGSSAAKASTGPSGVPRKKNNRPTRNDGKESSLSAAAKASTGPTKDALSRPVRNAPSQPAKMHRVALSRHTGGAPSWPAGQRRSRPARRPQTARLSTRGP